MATTRTPYKLVFRLANPLAAGASDSAKVAMSKGDNFVVQAISHFVTGPTTGVTKANEELPLILLQVKKRDNDKGLFDEPAPLTTVSGDGKEPHVLSDVFILPGNGSPVCEFENISTDKTYNNVFVVLHGYLDQS